MQGVAVANRVSHGNRVVGGARPGGGQARYTDYLFASSGSFEVPLGASHLYISLISASGGSGGSGGASANSWSSGSGGGSGSGYVSHTLVDAPAAGTVLEVTVPAGGSAGTKGTPTVNGGTGGKGGTAAFGTLATLDGGNGGGGGGRAAQGTGSGGRGGNGGSGGAGGAHGYGSTVEPRGGDGKGTTGAPSTTNGRPNGGGYEGTDGTNSAAGRSKASNQYYLFCDKASAVYLAAKGGDGRGVNTTTIVSYGGLLPTDADGEALAGTSRGIGRTGAKSSYGSSSTAVDGVAGVTGQAGYVGVRVYFGRPPADLFVTE